MYLWIGMFAVMCVVVLIVAIIDYIKTKTMEKNHETVQAFLEAWKKKDYKKMFSLCQLTWLEGKTEKDLETLLAGKKLRDFALISTTTLNSVCRKFFYELLIDDGTAIRSLISVICEEKPYQTATFGTWGVNPVSAVNAAEVLEKPEFTSMKKPSAKKSDKPATEKIAGPAEYKIPAKKPAEKKPRQKKSGK